MKQPSNGNLPYFRNLRVQVSAIYLVSSLLVICFMGYILYASISGIFMDMSLKTTTEAVERSAGNIEVYIAKLKTLSRVVSSHSDVKTYLAEGTGESRRRTLELIDQLLQSDPYLASIIIVSQDGRIVSNEAALDMTVSKNMMQESWYKQASSSNQMPVLTSIRQQGFTMDKADWVISISQEITDQNGRNMGVVLMDVRYQAIEGFLEKLNLGSSGYVFILNDADQVVYHKDTRYFEDDKLRQELVKISQMQAGYDRGMGMLTQHYAIQQTNWTLVGLSSLDELKQIQRHIMETLVLIGLVLFAVVLGSGLFMAKRFAAMSAEIEQLMAAVAENEKYLRGYELSALHSQINPHFLYNTLDTIVWMAEFGDSKQVIAITKALAQFFRLSLNQGRDMVSLMDELAHVTEYLFIQKARYGEQLDYELDWRQLPDKPERLEVPKIILQPIVENAIYHGIRELDHPGKVWITAERDADRLVLTVKDNGVGFSPDAPSKDVSNNKVRLGGVGLDNVNKRLKLYYGERFGLHTHSEIGVGTTVTLELPYRILSAHDEDREEGDRL